MSTTTDEQIDAFKADIEAVMRKHKLSISHEDTQGAFRIEPLFEDNIQWLKAAYYFTRA